MSFRIHDTHEYLKKASQPRPENEKKESMSSTSSTSSTVSSRSTAFRRLGPQPSGMKIKTSDATSHADYF